MSYAKSQTDKSNLNWFMNNKDVNTLAGIKITQGSIRGIFPSEVDFEYPISAFVGKNGSGKSTLLALAACSFHESDGFKQFPRKKTNFTYGDFFTFAKEEEGLKDIEIFYKIRTKDGDIDNK